MKILYHHRIASKDGQYVHVEELTRALSELGHELVMVGPRATSQADFGSAGGIVALIKRWLPKFVYELLELGYSVVAYRRLVRAIVEHHPDCIYERYNLYMPAGIWAKRRFHLPLLLEVNAPLFDERTRYGGIAFPRLARWTETFTWHGADAVLPVTEVLAARVRAAGVAASRIHVIPNGIDPRRFQPADTNAAKKALGLTGKLVLGFTGFVREWHGLEHVVDIVAKNEGDSRHLLIVGDGPARQSIEQRAARLGVKDRVTITGIIGRDEVARYINTFDVALQPDVVDYASPLKLFEYLALGKAVVAPAKANIREVLRDGQNAVLFAPETMGAFAAAVERLCREPALRAALGRAGLETIERGGYTWRHNAGRVESLFRQLGVTNGDPPHSTATAPQQPERTRDQSTS